MPTLEIRNVPDDLYRAVKQRAAENGQTIPEYTVAVLREAAAEQDD